MRDGSDSIVSYGLVDLPIFGNTMLPIHIFEIDSKNEYDISYVIVGDELKPTKTKKEKSEKLKNPTIIDLYNLVYEITKKLEVR